jgi:hypothetical protein
MITSVRYDGEGYQANVPVHVEPIYTTGNLVFRARAKFRLQTNPAKFHEFSSARGRIEDAVVSVMAQIESALASGTLLVEGGDIVSTKGS